MKYPLVEIEWIDSSSFERWTSLEDIAKAETLEVVTVGWLVGETGDAVAICSSVAFQDGDPKSGCGDIAIPKSAITKRRTLRKKGDDGKA